MLSLHCCTWAFSSCRECGLLFVAVCGHLIAVASCRADTMARGLQQLTQASIVATLGLSSCDSWSLEHRLDICGPWA